MPLTEDIEGPSSLDGVDFIVGARPITTGVDSNFVGQLTGLVITPHEAPPLFSRCVLQCLESMTADTTGTGIIAGSFDREERQLTLYGPATPDVFQSVLRTVTYLNLAPDINLASIEVDVNDGINSTVESITVVQGVSMRRKRDATTTISDTILQPRDVGHVISKRSIKEVTEQRKEESRPSMKSHWPIFMVGLSSVAVLLAVVVIWGVVQHKTHGPKSVV